ncbi:Gfo/Idh/MocA family oxidoreductase [Roseiconus lacunae]|uniref:Gfo/Idh/MocA family oxidoreductase n=1 Tax=Roseiconus lacunae TaxID=2605694 RepID=A0ABT7PM01_9BACT|nr:Gfo/Idh/MocA family oxidoreductase [Roseiconus lacunae]MDM4017500.1 Gfo/Idh/MocA family oxidoreductase [Roseiconus lacunae]WRQ53749.1 Gfo/Idh/MocA family oxidoreductase [Stieleria sp. HD01]
MSHSLNRRQVLKTGSAAAGLACFSTSTANGQATPSQKFRTAHIGVGGMGGSDLRSIASHGSVEVAALCDVDAKRLAEAAAKHPNAKTFTDYREMIATLGDSIDGVVVSTPDHTHAPAAMAAMNAGKPVYCQKPLTHEVVEARRLREVAEEKNLVTQMGIQIHSSRAYRQAVLMIQDGVIGKVKEVHAWSNKNWGYDKPSLPEPAAAPDHLNFDLWLGTAADREYVPGVYHPGQWRKLIDFGTGTLGDMGVHIFDTPYAALELTAPNWVKTDCRQPTGVGHPERNVVEYEFPQTRFTTETMKWKWYDGSFAPPSPSEVGLPEGTQLPGQGSLFVGEDGHLLLQHIADAVLFPTEKFKDYKRPEVEGESHYHQWVDACMGKGKASAPFSFGGPLTEALLLGVVANRFPNQKLLWNAEQMAITNHEAANKLLRSDYRQGFEVEGLS